MRRRSIALSIAAAATAVLALVACVDLFHSTSDLLDACQLDADTDGCTVVEAGVADAAPDAADASIDLCSFTQAEARANAEAACAWLGACETPLGQNRYATCVEHAILAYDCTANASLPVRGAALDFWTCMVTARDCAAVHACAWGVDQPNCPATGHAVTVCDENGAQQALAQRGQCPGDGGVVQPHAENCAAWGQTCSYQATTATAACAGDSKGNGNGDCTASACMGTQLFSCDDAGDNVGIDCKNYGAQECVTTGGFPACAPASTTACSDTGSPGEVGCTETFQYAVGCPDGRHQETIDCFALTEGNGKCSPTATPGWDVSRACGGSVACSFNDQCVGSSVQSCDRGIIYTYACASPFTGCKMVTTADGDFPRAQCGAP